MLVREPIRIHKLKISLDPNEKTLIYELEVDGQSLRPERCDWRESEVRAHVHEILRFLETGAKDLSEFEKAGSNLFDALFPPNSPSSPSNLSKWWFDDENQGSYVVLKLHEDVVWIPWELLCHNKEFLCQRFLISRQVGKTYEQIKTSGRKLEGPFKGVVLWGDAENLRVKSESRAVMAAFKEIFGGRSERKPDLSSRGMLRELCGGYAIAHFIGHGAYEERKPEATGWRCHDRSLLSCSEIESLPGKPSLPLLVFANSCESARASCQIAGVPEEYIGNLALAFLFRGVPHYIGTVAKVPDEESRKFAERFYQELRLGATMGQALGKARSRFFADSELPIWAYYVHYGDPLNRLIEDVRAEAAAAPSLRHGRLKSLHYGMFLGLGMVLLAVALLLASRGGVRYYFERFGTDTLGIAIFDLAIQNELSGRHESGRYLQADAIRRKFATIRFPQKLEIRNIPRVLENSEDARTYGIKTRSKVVVWGYGKKGKDTLQLHIVTTPILTPTEDISPSVRTLRAAFLADASETFEIKLATLQEFDTRVMPSVVTTLLSVGLGGYMLSVSDQSALRAARDACLSCVESYEVSEDDKWVCKLHLGGLYIMQGKTRVSDELIQQSIGGRAYAVSRGIFTLMKTMYLGLPADPGIGDEKLVWTQDDESRLEVMELIMAVCQLNADYFSTQALGNVVLQKLSADKGLGKFLTPSDAHESATLRDLAYVDLKLGHYTAAKIKLEQIEQIKTLVWRATDSMLPEPTRYDIHLGNYREGDPASAKKALAEAADDLERAEVLELQGHRGTFLRQLRQDFQKGDESRADLARALVAEGLRTGDSAFFKEAVSLCDGQSFSSSIEDAQQYRYCQYLAADGQFFLGLKRESFQRYLKTWPLEQLELSNADKVQVLVLQGYAATRRYRDFDVASELYEKAQALKLHDSPWIDLAKVRMTIGSAYSAIQKGDVQHGMGLLQSELNEPFTRHVPRYYGAIAYYLRAAMAWAYASTGRINEANTIIGNKEMKESQERLFTLPGPNVDIVSGFHRWRGLINRAQGQWQQAIVEYQKCLDAVSSDERGPVDEEGMRRAHFYLSLASLESHAESRALDYLSKLSRIHAENENPEKCLGNLSHRYAELGNAWEPQLCRDLQLLQRRIASAERDLSANPTSVELRDKLFLLLMIERALGHRRGDYGEEKTLLKEAIKLDLRDSFNVPGISGMPSRRYIDLAILALKTGNSEEALQALRDCVIWYTGDSAANLWSLEMSALLDELNGIIPRQEKFPPYYFPSLYWPRFE